MPGLAGLKDRIQGLFQSPAVQQAAQKGAIPDAEPQNLIQQLVLQVARANPGEVIIRNLGDAPRLQSVYGPGDWVKMQFVEHGYTVHYFENLATGMQVEFKFTFIPPGG